MWAWYTWVEEIYFGFGFSVCPNQYVTFSNVKRHNYLLPLIIQKKKIHLNNFFYTLSTLFSSTSKRTCSIFCQIHSLSINMWSLMLIKCVGTVGHFMKSDGSQAQRIGIEEFPNVFGIYETLNLCPRLSNTLWVGGQVAPATSPMCQYLTNRETRSTGIWQPGNESQQSYTVKHKKHLSDKNVFLIL